MSETGEQQPQADSVQEPMPIANFDDGIDLHHIKLFDVWPHAPQVWFSQTE
jgi:hypothetical protein